MNVNKYFITFETDAPKQREVNSPEIVRMFLLIDSGIYTHFI